MKIFFCAIAFLIVLRPAFPYLEYAFNYDYIVNVLCVNKDRPEMQCNGKCHLKQELTEAATNETNPKKDKPAKQNSIQLLFFEKFKPLDGIAFMREIKPKKSIFRTSRYAFCYNAKLLRPPITA